MKLRRRQVGNQDDRTGALTIVARVHPDHKRGQPRNRPLEAKRGSEVLKEKMVGGERVELPTSSV